MAKIYNVYTIRELDNGFLLSIHEDAVPIETTNTSYTESIERLITHLANQLNLEEE